MTDARESETSSPAFDLLLARMGAKGDFPGLSGVAARILNLSSSDRESVASLTNEILKDVGLTQRLLRLVNSVHYARGQTIRTVSRAVSLVGFNGIRNLTLSLVLLEHMRDGAHAARVRDEFLRALVAGTIARELAARHGDGEEAFIAAMFQHLGRMLAEYYFPEEAARVRNRVASGLAASENLASAHELGVSYLQLALKVVRLWGLPDIVLHAQRSLSDTPPLSTPPADERLQWTARTAHEAVRILIEEAPQAQASQLRQTCERFAPALGTDAATAQKAVARAREAFGDLAQALGVEVEAGSSAARLLRAVAQPHAMPAPGVVETPGSDAPAMTVPGALEPAPYMDTEPVESDSELAPDEALVAAADERQRALETLTSGIQDVISAMVEEHRLVDVLRMVLETMLRAMEFDRVVFCMRDSRTDTLTGRVGLGQGVEPLVRLFQVSLAGTAPSRDLFAAVCAKGVDTLIQNSAEIRVRERLPAWYRDSVDAPAFLLMPLRQGGAPFGLIYADRLAQRPPLAIGDRELALLRTLRNQAVLAFRQSRG